MKIAMIGHKDYPSREGGVEVVVSELAERMQKRGHQVTLYNRGRDGKKAHEKVNGIEVYRVKTPKSSALNAFVYSLRATCHAIFQYYDVIHYHAIGPSAMIFLPKLFHIRTIATVHGLDWQRAKWGGFATRYLRFAEKMMAKRADEIIVLTRPAQLYFRSKYGRETTLIENGITIVDRAEPDLITKELGLTRHSYILFLARIEPEKGLHYLIEAYKMLHTDVKLVIAGRVPDNEYGAKLLEMAKDNPNILFAGFVTGRLHQELMSNCLIYVLPSEIEGLALSLLEAMSCGARCLASDIPENADVVDRYGYTFRTKNVNSLRSMLALLLETNPENLAGEEQAAYIQQQHNWESVTDRTIALYHHHPTADSPEVRQIHRLLEENEQLAAKLLKSNEANHRMADVLCATIESRSVESARHAGQMRLYTEALLRSLSRTAPEYNLSADRIDMMSRAAVMHDVGKIAISDSLVLERPGKLSDEERLLAREHVGRGCDILRQASLYESAEYAEYAQEICRHHHERYDGSGYPDHLIGEAIPISAQAASVADVFHSLVSKRPFRNPFPPEEAGRMILDGECGAFGPKILKSLREALPDLIKIYHDCNDDLKA